MTTTIVPANPGFYVLRASAPDFVLRRYAILAWEVDTSGACPITYDGRMSHTAVGAHTAIERPNMQVEARIAPQDFTCWLDWLEWVKAGAVNG